MAHQEFNEKSKIFILDLHGVRTMEAARILRIRINECYKYGLHTLKVIYGSPDRFEGSILEALRTIVEHDPHVVRNELPDWIFSCDGTGFPIFLAIPIVRNRQPTQIDDAIVFQMFKAEFEENIAQKLLCEVPFQPRRAVYSWDYAARAVGRKCDPSSLRAMCKSLGLMLDGVDGLSFSAMARAAELFPKWRTNRSPATATHLPAEPRVGPCVPLSAPLSDDRTFGFSGLPSKPGVAEYLILSTRYLEAAEYESAARAIDLASGHCKEPLDTLDVAILKARLGLRTHDPRVESALLEADSLCVKLLGESAPRRRQILLMLASWYESSGESERVLRFYQMYADQFPREKDGSRERMLLAAVRVAVHAYEASDLWLTMEILLQCLWKVILGKKGNVPRQWQPSTALPQIRTSHLPRRLLCEWYLVLARTVSDWSSSPDSGFVFLKEAEKLAKIAPPDVLLLARIEHEIAVGFSCDEWRQADALEHFEEAEALYAQAPFPDSVVQFQIALNKGNLLLRMQQLKPAAAAFAQAEAIAEGLFAEDHRALAPLYSDMARLNYKERRYKKAIALALRSAEILELKSPASVIEIALAYSVAGTAAAEAGNRASARRYIEQSHAFYAQSPYPLPEEVKDIIDREKRKYGLPGGSIHLQKL